MVKSLTKKVFGVKVAQALASAWPDEDISCGSRDEPDRVTNRRLAIGASPATIAHRALMIMFRQSRCGVDGRSPSALLRGSHSDPFAIAKPHVIAVVDLLRSYSNRSDLLARLNEVCRLVGQPGACEHDAATLTVSARAVQPWRVRDRLTDDDVNRLIAEFLAGRSKRELAGQYGISFSTVKNILRLHGVRRT